MRLERRKRQSKPFHLIRPESTRHGERDRCVRDEISGDESPLLPLCHKPRQLLEYKFRAIARVVCVLSAKSPKRPLSDRASPRTAAVQRACSDLRDYTTRDYGAHANNSKCRIINSDEACRARQNAAQKKYDARRISEDAGSRTCASSADSLIDLERFCLSLNDDLILNVLIFLAISQNL